MSEQDRALHVVASGGPFNGFRYPVTEEHMGRLSDGHAVSLSLPLRPGMLEEDWPTMIEVAGVPHATYLLEPFELRTGGVLINGFYWRWSKLTQRDAERHAIFTVLEQLIMEWHDQRMSGLAASLKASEGGA